MGNTQDLIDRFFARYAATFTDALAGNLDLEATSAAFGEVFIGATPGGLALGHNNQQFREAIPKGYEFYRSVGTKAMELVAKEVTMIDDFHAMVRVHWKSINFKNTTREEISIEFDVVYLLQILNDQPKIFAYITGDEMQAYQKSGLLDEKGMPVR